MSGDSKATMSRKILGVERCSKSKDLQTRSIARLKGSDKLNKT